jgi:hypothetical protein
LRGNLDDFLGRERPRPAAPETPDERIDRRWGFGCPQLGAASGQEINDDLLAGLDA